MMEKKAKPNTYTCKEYREEMILAALRKRLEQEELSESERAILLEEIAQLEEKMGL